MRSEEQQHDLFEKIQPHAEARLVDELVLEVLVQGHDVEEEPVPERAVVALDLGLGLGHLAEAVDLEDARTLQLWYQIVEAQCQAVHLIVKFLQFFNLKLIFRFVKIIKIYPVTVDLYEVIVLGRTNSISTNLYLRRNLICTKFIFLDEDNFSK